MKKIGIFYVNAGGGHSGTAKALAKEISENYSNTAFPVLIDAMNGGPFLARWFLERGYALAVNNFPNNWRIIYWFSKLRSVMRGEDKVFSFTAKKNIIENIEKENFDVIVTVHFFLTSPVLEYLETNKIDIPVYCIVTDPFTAPPIWFINKNIKYFVFSEIAREIALQNGISQNNIFTVAPLIGNKFLRARNFDKLEIRKKLRFPLDKKIILVAAGGDGLYRGEKILQQLVGLSDEFKIVVVCGREEKFFRQANILKRKNPQKIVEVFGFVDNMEELMSASDLVLGKAGPATIFESLAVSRPLILTHYIWEQEKGNCDFVVENGLGFYEPNLKFLKDRINSFFSKKDISLEIEQKIASMFLRSGVGDIAKKILETKNPE